MAIRKWKLEKNCMLPFEGSLALYDCEDMVVFVKDAGMVDFVAKNEGIILETLQSIPIPVLSAFRHMLLNCVHRSRITANKT